MKTIILLLLLTVCTVGCIPLPNLPTANLSASLPTVTAIPAPTPPTATARPETCRVIAEVLHLRNAPNIQGTVIAWLLKNDQLTILSNPPLGAWIQVTTADNQTGFVNSHYCER